MALIVMVKWSESIIKFLKSNEQGCTSMQVIVELLDGLAGLYYDFMFELNCIGFSTTVSDFIFRYICAFCEYIVLNSKCADLYTPLSPKVSWYIQSNGEWKQKDDEGSTPNFITVLRQDYFK